MVILIVAAATYKSWWYKLNKKQIVTNTVFETKPAPVVEQRSVFLPKTTDAVVTEINPQTKQLVLTSSGVVYLADGGTGEVKQSLTAEQYPDANFSTAVVVDSDYFAVSGLTIQRFDHNGKFMRSYSAKDGLVNIASMRLHSDPFAPHTLWIETYDGVSRLDTETNQFTNYNQALKIGSQESKINGIHLTSKAVWFQVAASSVNSGGLSRLDRITGKWQTWGPDGFGLSDHLDFGAVAANDNNAVAQISTSIYVLNSKTRVWDKIPSLEFSQDATPYGTLYLEGDYLYVALSDGSVEAALLTDSAPSWQQVISGSGVFADRGLAQQQAQLIPDTALGLWMQTDSDKLVRLANGTTGESLQLPKLEQTGDFFAANGNGVYYSLPNGMGRYDISNGKKMSWLTDPKQTDYSDLRIVRENNGYAYVIEASTPGYLSGGLQRFVRLSLNNPNDITQYKAPDAINPFYDRIQVADDGRIFMVDSTNKKPVVTMFDWDKLMFVPATAPPNLELLTSNTIYPYQSTPLVHEGLTIDSFKNTATTLEVTLHHNTAARLTVKFTFPAGGQGPYGNLQTVNLNTAVLDNTDSNVVWLATTQGLVRLTLNDKNYKLFPSIDGASFTSVSSAEPLGDFLVLSTNAGTYIYPKTKFQ